MKKKIFNKKINKKNNLNANKNKNNKEVEIDEIDIDNSPYTQALRLNKRNIFIMFFNIFKMKIEIIALSIYSLDFLFSYFMNALLYSDDVVSQKYHNNGSLDLITSLSLSIISNIVSY